MAVLLHQASRCCETILNTFKQLEYDITAIRKDLRIIEAFKRDNASYHEEDVMPYMTTSDIKCTAQSSTRSNSSNTTSQQFAKTCASSKHSNETVQATMKTKMLCSTWRQAIYMSSAQAPTLTIKATWRTRSSHHIRDGYWSDDDLDHGTEGTQTSLALRDATCSLHQQHATHNGSRHAYNTLHRPMGNRFQWQSCQSMGMRYVCITLQRDTKEVRSRSKKSKASTLIKPNLC